MSERTTTLQVRVVGGQLRIALHGSGGRARLRELYGEIVPLESRMLEAFDRVRATVPGMTPLSDGFTCRVRPEDVEAIRQNAAAVEDAELEVTVTVEAAEG
jgi:hypothetical protein